MNEGSKRGRVPAQHPPSRMAGLEITEAAEAGVDDPVHLEQTWALALVGGIECELRSIGEGLGGGNGHRRDAVRERGQIECVDLVARTRAVDVGDQIDRPILEIDDRCARNSHVRPVISAAERCGHGSAEIALQQNGATTGVERINRVVCGDDVEHIMYAAGNLLRGHEQRLCVDLVIKGHGL